MMNLLPARLYLNEVVPSFSFDEMNMRRRVGRTIGRREDVCRRRAGIGRVGESSCIGQDGEERHGRGTNVTHGDYGADLWAFVKEPEGTSAQPDLGIAHMQCFIYLNSHGFCELGRLTYNTSWHAYLQYVPT